MASIGLGIAVTNSPLFVFHYSPNHGKLRNSVLGANIDIMAPRNCDSVKEIRGCE
jgi:hypothetical protein